MVDTSALENLVMHYHDAILILDKNHRILYANAKAAEILKQPATELLGEICPDTLVHDIPFSIEKEGRYHLLKPNWQPISWKDQAASVLSLEVLENKDADTQHSLSTHDFLTNLPNRPFFETLLSAAVKRCNRGGQKLALMLLAPGHISDLRKSYDGAQGAAILHIKNILQAQLRESDMLAYIGDHCFAIILEPVNSFAAAGVVASKLIRETTGRFHTGDVDIPLNANVGIALYPDGGVMPSELLAHAQESLEKAQAHGLGQYAYYTDALDEGAQRVLEVDIHLRHALEKKELTMFFQPQVHLLDGRISGCEALIRWQNDEIGSVEPEEFIPLLEGSGSIVSVGRWILEESCRQYRAAAMLKQPVAVNISVMQLLEKDFVQQVEQVLNKYDMPADSLMLELTETMLIQNVNLVASKLKALASMGVQIVMDDFGTGYCSLAVLKTLPFSKLKIDKSFIADIAQEPHAQTLTNAIVHMAKDLGLTTVAEGVETKEQLEFLREAGCDQVQGFLIGKPMDILALEGFCSSWTGL